MYWVMGGFGARPAGSETDLKLGWGVGFLDFSAGFFGFLVGVSV